MTSLHRTIALTAMMAVVSVPVSTVENQRDTKPVTVGEGVIAGRVTHVAAGKPHVPADGARVRIRGEQTDAGGSVVTDSEGRYVLRGLPEGVYTVVAELGGQVPGNYGASRPGRPGIPVRIARGEVRSDIDINLVAAGAVAGTVTNQSGRGLPGVRVVAAQVRFVRGIHTLVRIGLESTTDAHGRFRLYDLVPGQYVISASIAGRGAEIGRVRSLSQAELSLARSIFRDLVSGSSPVPPPSQVDDETVSFTPIFFPSETSAETAAQIAVVSGQETSGVGIVARPVSTAGVTGRVSMPAGLWRKGLEVAVVAKGPRLSTSGRPVTRVPLSSAGDYEAGGLAPGSYQIVVKVPASQRADTLWASKDIKLLPGAREQVDLAVEAGGSVAGRLEAGVSSQTLRISLLSTGEPSVTTALSPVGPVVINGAEFRFDGIQPGAYRWSAGFSNGGQVDPQGRMILGLFRGGKDVLDEPVDVRPGPPGEEYTLRLTTQLSGLSGRLIVSEASPPADHWIVVFPVDSNHWSWSTSRIAAFRPDTDGRFSRHLRPGAYYLAAMVGLEPGEQTNIDLLRELKETAVQVEIVHGRMVPIDLHVKR